MHHLSSCVDALVWNFEKLSINAWTSSSTICGTCGVIRHSSFECQYVAPLPPDVILLGHVNYLNNFNQKGDPFAPTYDPRLQNHPNLSHKNPPLNPTSQSNVRPQIFPNPRPPFPNPQKSNLDLMMENFIASKNK